MKSFVMKSTRTLDFLENILLFVFIQILICFSNTRAQNETNSSIESISIELNDENPIQYIQSPGFPTKPYPKNYSVNYDLNVNLSDRIEGLAARIGIKLEYMATDPSDDCKDTHLTISFPKGEMRVFCGVHAGKTMISESGSAKIQFRGNGLEQDRGFKIRTEIIRSKCSHKFVNISEGTISSPNYPNNYTNEETCVWEVEAPEGKFVKLIFDEPFDIMASNDNICAEDYLLISKSGDLGTDVQRFCGNQTPEAMVSHSNKMLIKFNSGCCESSKGFRLRFAEHDRPEAAPERLRELTPEGCACGLENLRSKRIVGGTVVNPPHRYPWMVAIVSIRGSPFCGAVLINNYYVLTAAHCVYKENTESIGVRMGQFSLQESTPILRISKIIVHKQYNSVSQSNDIALIKLKDPVQFDHNIQPVCLPPSDLDEPDGLFVAGWGRVDEGGRTSDQLRQINLPEYPFAKCEDKYSGLLTTKQFCAGGIKGQDACQGDSGGPLSSRINGRVDVVGVVSWGIGCAREDYPGVYTRVTAYLPWIEDNTKDSTYCLGNTSNDNSTNQVLDKPIQPNFDNCGLPNLKVSKRVVGGSETAPQEFPWIVVIANNGQLIGSGSLIASNVVLTSAQRLKRIYDSSTETRDLKIIVGAHDITQTEASKRVYRVNQIIFHPKFGFNTPVDYDFALLELKSTEEGFLPAFRPVCLPRSDTPYRVGSTVISAGWGRTSTYAPGSPVLMKVMLHLSDRYQCSQTYRSSVTNAMVCASDDYQDMCLGDTGAPLMQFFEGRMYLLGVYSWQSKEGCGTGKPSVFGDVRYALQWISDVTNNGIKTA